MSGNTRTAPQEKRENVVKQDRFIPRPPPEDNGLHPLVNEQMSKDVWILLIAFRCINALCVRTFFQPDEYFQSLEPAWQMAFGAESGAWITWEWHHQLRSSLHPALFAILYYVMDKAMEFLQFFPQFRAMLLSVLPNVVQGIIAGIGDYYTWQLSERIYGTGSNTAWAALLLTVFSPWQWFCSTRTFSNCLETTMTIAALNFWPWNLTTDTILAEGSDPTIKTEKTDPSAPAKAGTQGVLATPQSIKQLRISLLLAALACILRPTNLLIWFCIAMPTLTKAFSSTRPPTASYIILLREAVLCGAVAIAISAISDYVYFGEWTFPPYQWLHFNISQDLAIFYGRNDFHYYVSQGLPLLLTTYLPFALISLYQSTSLPATDIRFLLTTTILVTLSTLSLISHKEVRFIYPLLPLLHILTAPTITTFFQTTITTATNIAQQPPSSSSPSAAVTKPISTKETITKRKPLLYLILLLNLTIAGYTTLIHQRGVVSLLPFLRSEYESLALDIRGVELSDPASNTYGEFPKETNYDPNETFVGFLMPCHSTPWRSQLIYPGMKAWALGCEPPIHLKAGSKEREEYRDEADRFYDDPLGFLRREVNTQEKPWPRYIVGFEGIEKPLKEYYETEMKGFKAREKWRGHNSHCHDDSRRRGDVVLWEFVDGSAETGKSS